jgi:hypothetical protein
LIVQFKAQQEGAGDGSDDGGGYELQVACSWRMAGPTSIIVGSGDLFTPSDADAELETFDWDVSGASWWDKRMEELRPTLTDTTVAVMTFVADSLGGFRLVCTGGIELEVFPNSSPAPHVETEFWRLIQPGRTEPDIVVGTSGIELVHHS